MTKAMSRKQKITLICFALKVNTGDVFSVDGDLNQLWRITEENGLEKFQGCYGWTGDKHLVAGSWSYPLAGDIDLGTLLLGNYTLKVYPNSPLKGMKFCKTYALLDLLGDGMKCE